MSHIQLLLMYGGRSSEHEVSIASATNVYGALDASKYDTTICYVDRDGKWWLVDEVRDNPSTEVQLLPMLGQSAFVTVPGDTKVVPDVILPMIHGDNGEDGTLQGLAQLLRIPCVGPSVLSAAVTLDKDMTKRLLQFADIPVVPWKTWLVKDRKPTYDMIATELGSNVFVKPASAGSSIGVSHVTSATDWESVLDEAAKHSELVLIEKAIVGREVDLGVLGNDDPQVSVPGEIISGQDFYTYSAKYDDSTTAQLVIPADLSADVTKKLQEYALRAFQVTESRGLARVDFLLDNEGAIYLNEINSIPGFTSHSMYPKLWEHQGMTYPELIDELVRLALE